MKNREFTTLAEFSQYATKADKARLEANLKYARESGTGPLMRAGKFTKSAEAPYLAGRPVVRWNKESV